MARRALTLREGRAPVWDRLLTMLFLAGLLHGLIILGLTFNAAASDNGERAGPRGAAGLRRAARGGQEPHRDLPGAAHPDRARATPARRWRRATAPRRCPTLRHAGTAEGNSLERCGTWPPARPRTSRCSPPSPGAPTCATSPRPGEAGAAHEQPLLIDQPPAAEPGPDEQGPAQLRGPQRDELWITPDTRASIARAVPGRLAAQGGAHRHPQLPDRGARAGGDQPARSWRSASPPTASSTACSSSRSSGNPELDQAALAILKLASPFDPFPPELAAQYRVLRFRLRMAVHRGRAQRGAVSVP